MKTSKLLSISSKNYGEDGVGLDSEEINNLLESSILTPEERFYTKEEVKELCEKSFDAGQAYVQGSHKDFIQTHKNKEAFIAHLGL
jgi:hypothetical protein